MSGSNSESNCKGAPAIESREEVRVVWPDRLSKLLDLPHTRYFWCEECA